MKYLFALISISMSSVSMIADSGGITNLNSLAWFQFKMFHTHVSTTKTQNIEVLKCTLDVEDLQDQYFTISCPKF